MRRYFRPWTDRNARRRSTTERERERNSFYMCNEGTRKRGDSEWPRRSVEERAATTTARAHVPPARNSHKKTPVQGHKHRSAEQIIQDWKGPAGRTAVSLSVACGHDRLCSWTQTKKMLDRNLKRKKKKPQVCISEAGVKAFSRADSGFALNDDRRSPAVTNPLSSKATVMISTRRAATKG